MRRVTTAIARVRQGERGCRKFVRSATLLLRIGCVFASLLALTPTESALGETIMVATTKVIAAKKAAKKKAGKKSAKKKAAKKKK